jgi:hypothetical protein
VKTKGDFSEEDKIRALLWSNRHCCLCGKACGTDIEIAHIERKGKNKSWEIDNAIPLCYQCHAEIGKYNQQHPRGNKYRPKELKARREQIYEEQTRHLVPPIQYRITQTLVSGGKRIFPDIGLTVLHLGDSLPVKLRVLARIFLDQKDLGLPEPDLYSGKKIWNRNPRFGVHGHFTVPVEKIDDGQQLEIRVTVTVIDQYEREHQLLPVGWIYMPRINSWYLEP